MYIAQILSMSPFSALDLLNQAATTRLLKTPGVATGLEDDIRRCFEIRRSIDMHPAEALLSSDAVDVDRDTKIPNLIRRLAAMTPNRGGPRFMVLGSA